MLIAERPIGLPPVERPQKRRNRAVFAGRQSTSPCRPRVRRSGGWMSNCVQLTHFSKSFRGVGEPNLLHILFQERYIYIYLINIYARARARVCVSRFLRDFCFMGRYPIPHEGMASPQPADQSHISHAICAPCRYGPTTYVHSRQMRTRLRAPKIDGLPLRGQAVYGLV